MSIRTSLAKLFVLVMLDLGAVAGVPITPEQIRNLMRVMNETVVTQTIDGKKNDDSIGHDARREKHDHDDP